MKRGMWMLAAVAALVTGGAAQATTYDQNVTSPPGWIDGSGNPNGGFTVVSDGGIELGLRAKYRQNPNVIHTNSDLYLVVAGPQTAATSGGPAASNRAAWNYEFAINLNPTNAVSGYLTLNDIVATLTISDTHGHTATVDPLAYWTDDSGYNGSKNSAISNMTTDWAAQNSQNPVFTGATGFPLQAYFNMNASETYTFTLSVSSDAAHGGELLATDSMRVQVVPLPASAWGGLALLGGLAVARRRKPAVASA